MRVSAALIACVLGLVAASCGVASSRGVDDPTTVPSVTATATVIATATPTATPQPAPLSTDRLGRSLWSGPLDLYPLAVELIPGRHPDTSSWRVSLSGNPATCAPTPTPAGWTLNDCVNDLPDIEFSIDVPERADGVMTVTITGLVDGVSEARTASLQLLHDRDEPPSHNVTRVWSHRALRNPGTSDVWSADGVVFAPHFGGFVELLDANAGRPLSVIDLNPLLGAGDRSAAVLDVKARDGLLYVATASDGLFIYDLAQPATPEFVGWYVRPPEVPETPEGVWNIHNIYLDPDRAIVYLINQSGLSHDLRLLDVSDPTAPVEVGYYSVPNPLEEDIFAHDVNVQSIDRRQIAYVNYWDAGLRILDTTDPTAIVELGVWNEEAARSHAGWPFEIDGRSYYAHGGEGYDKGLTVLDITDPAAPTVVSRYESRDGISIHNIEVRDGFAYIADYIDGLRVVDLRDPANPREVAHYDTVPSWDEEDLFGGAWGVHLSGNGVFLSDRQFGIYAFIVELPTD